MNNISKKITKISNLIKESDYILIGAGSGLSTAAGIEYFGERFYKNFADFIKKYHFTDMYSSAFYDFKTQEEKWAYFAKHIYLNNVGMEATDTYKKLLKLVKNKEYFVLTTNVDDQFEKAGFDKKRIFATQGSYRYIQCSHACHNKLYDDSDLVKEMIAKTNEDLKIPTKLVPKCPICGEDMDVNLRKDAYFVQDEHWYEQDEKYGEFLDKAKDKKVVLLEFGVGFNTPGIIRFPFEKMTFENENWNLVRFNKDNPSVYLDIEDKTTGIFENINDVLKELLEKEQEK